MIKSFDNDEIEDLLLKESNASDENRAIFAIRAMKNYYTPRILERLIEIITTEQNDDKVVHAIYSLSTKPPIESVLKPLKDQLFNEKEPIRSAAVKVLSEYGKQILKELGPLLEKKNELRLYTQKSIIWLMGKIGTEKTYNYLKNWGNTTENEEIKDSIEDALRNLKRKIMRISLAELSQLSHS